MKPRPQTILIAIILGAFQLARATAPTSAPSVKPEDLPRIKPTEPADAVKTFKVRPGFHIELVAAEPLVVDPIAMCFDENGRLFVVEMRDYSERRAEKLGRIRMLEDTNNDGVFDKSTIFLENLPWPTALFYYKGGLLVGATPDILYAKDTDGDGKADDVQKLFTGFGATQQKLNVQGLFNNFIWGLDNRIHGCSGHDGGLIERIPTSGSPAAKGSRAAGSARDQGAPHPLDVRSKGFVIDPTNWSMTTEMGGGQYGLCCNPTGQLFTCTNSSHCETFMYDGRYAARNPSYTPPDPRISIAADGPAAEVFRISPEEPWRVIRTRWRIAGLAAGPVEGGGRSAGYFTGATGITIYKGNAYGPDYVGDAFIGDAGGNLVHHKRVRRSGLDLIAERPADEKTIEFCASTDTWFRPVDFANAPDGCLYIADMYRETIEHPWSIPESIKQYLDLNSGNDRGRIYRLVPDGFIQPASARLGAATTKQLVETLGHPNGWHRETAARLLFERQDSSALPPLRDMLKSAPTAFAQLHALHAIDGLAALTEDDVLIACDSGNESVRAHAVSLSERFIHNRKISDPIWSRLKSLASDSSILVRQQVAFTLGEIDHPERSTALAAIARQDFKNPWMRAAVMTSLSRGAADALLEMSRDSAVASSDLGRGFMSELAQSVGGSGQRKDVDTILDLALHASRTDHPLAFTLAGGLCDGADRAHSVKPSAERLAPLFERASEIARHPGADGRQAAIAFLSHDNYEHAAPALFAALDDADQSIQLTALTALERYSSAELADEILSRWHKLPPRVRSEAASLLVRQPDRARSLLLAIKNKSIEQSDLDASQINQLLTSKDAQVRELAAQTLSAPLQRGTVVENFRSSLTLSGDPTKGHDLYQKRCISCHRAGPEGSLVGPDLVTVKNGGKEKLLTSILDPNREVAPNYIGYSIDTTDGQNLLGILTSDTSASITIRQAYGKELTLPRTQIKRMTSQGKSLMPEGLEQDLTPQQFADLLEFVAGAGAPPK
jgi:putative membrane-bound dehydrogenase-like protein